MTELGEKSDNVENGQIEDDLEDILANYNPKVSDEGIVVIDYLLKIYFFLLCLSYNLFL